MNYELLMGVIFLVTIAGGVSLVVADSIRERRNPLLSLPKDVKENEPLLPLPRDTEEKR